MREKLSSAVISLLIALTIWLFAESQSLGEASDTGRIVFGEAAGGGSVVTARDWDGQIALDLRGSRTAIARARAILDASPIMLRPGMPGVPTADGTYSIDLMLALAAYEPLSRAGVTITSVSPPRAEIISRETTREDIPVTPHLEDLEVEGAVRVTPDHVSVRLPKAVWDRVGESLRIEATPAPEDRAKLREGEQATIPAALVLPPELLGEPGVQVNTQSVMLSFTVRSTTSKVKVDLVPVWVVVPPSEARDPALAVDVAQADQLLTVELSGPREAIDRLLASNDKVIAMLSLTSDEIDAGISSKAVGFGVLRGGVMLPLPEGVKATCAKTAIGVSIKRTAP